MKQLLTIVFLLLFTTSYSQVTVNKLPKQTLIGSSWGLIPNVHLYQNLFDNGDTTYSLVYGDEQYKSIPVVNTITFIGGTKCLDDCYSILNSLIDSTKGTEISFNLSENRITAYVVPTLYGHVLNLTITDIIGTKGKCTLNRKSIKKLFNKQDN